jgi:catechol 2,3-dioxygenase-like lactoylglutathione lyase family enzyme
MFDGFPVSARLPATDLDRARAWYEQKLGLKPSHEDMGGLWYQTGGSWFLVYPTEFAGTAKNTAAGWSVKDIETLVADLRARDVVFEEYEIPGAQLVDGLLTMGPFKAAWFKDSEGNILEISQVP